MLRFPTMSRELEHRLVRPSTNGRQALTNYPVLRPTRIKTAGFVLWPHIRNHVLAAWFPWMQDCGQEGVQCRLYANRCTDAVYDRRGRFLCRGDNSSISCVQFMLSHRWSQDVRPFASSMSQHRRTFQQSRPLFLCHCVCTTVWEPCRDTSAVAKYMPRGVPKLCRRTNAARTECRSTASSSEVSLRIV